MPNPAPPAAATANPKPPSGTPGGPPAPGPSGVPSAPGAPAAAAPPVSVPDGPLESVTHFVGDRVGDAERFTGMKAPVLIPLSVAFVAALGGAFWLAKKSGFPRPAM